MQKLITINVLVLNTDPDEFFPWFITFTAKIIFNWVKGGHMQSSSCTKLISKQESTLWNLYSLPVGHSQEQQP